MSITSSYAPSMHDIGYDAGRYPGLSAVHYSGLSSLSEIFSRVYDSQSDLMRFLHPKSFARASRAEMEEYELGIHKGFLDCLQEDPEWRQLLMNLPHSA
jgi:hypothetical protein